MEKKEDCLQIPLCYSDLSWLTGFTFSIHPGECSRSGRENRGEFPRGNKKEIKRGIRVGGGSQSRDEKRRQDKKGKRLWGMSKVLRECMVLEKDAL
jgi:hypothetical protein